MMTIKQIYNLAIEMGINADLRSNQLVRKRLKKLKMKYDKMKAEEKKEFDQEQLTNPYSDTRIYVGDPNKKVKRVLAGIDIDTSEVLLAKELSARKPIDLIISHHPLGSGLAGLHEVMHMQAEILTSYGIPINIAQSLLKIRIDEVARSVSAINHNKTIDAARILGFALMSVHTPTDNLVTNLVKKMVDKNKKNLETVEDVMKLLKTIPEYQKAIQDKAGPRLFAGSPDNFAGKIAITEMTGGTEGAKEIYEKLAQAGIGTVIGMHMSEEHKKEAEKHHVNVIIAGHISSDSIGVNLFLDQLEKKGIEIIPCSGLIRERRFKKRKK